jgi:succinoglycan biosynthesis transport protein ExoP
LNSALGLLAGAFFGIAFVVVQERADRTIQGPGDTAVILTCPSWARSLRKGGTEPALRLLPERKLALESKKSENGKPSQVELVTSNKKPSLLADSFRATLTSILYSGENGDRPRVIVITSANPGEGKTTVASNLALALAEIASLSLCSPSS